MRLAEGGRGLVGTDRPVVFVLRERCDVIVSCFGRYGGFDLWQASESDILGICSCNDSNEVTIILTLKLIISIPLHTSNLGPPRPTSHSTSHHSLNPTPCLWNNPPGSYFSATPLQHPIRSLQVLAAEKHCASGSRECTVGVGGFVTGEMF